MTRTRKRRAKVDAELQREKASELQDDRNEFLVSPHHKLTTSQLTIVKAHVRALFKDVFEVNQDDDFALYHSILPETARAYASGDGDGPDMNALRINMIGGVNSRWNQKVLDILLVKLKDVREKDQWSLPNRSDMYLADLIKDRLKRAVKVWAKSQRKTNNAGTLESWDDVEQRLVAEKEGQLLLNRHATQRRNVSILAREG